MTRLRLVRLALLAVLVATVGGLRVYLAAQAPVPPADLVLRNGTFVTLDAKVPGAQALAARGGRIVAVGSNADVQKYVGKGTQVIDLAGQFATPGFIEGHGHFTGVGQMKLGLELQGAKTWNDIVAMVAAAVKKAKPGQW